MHKPDTIEGIREFCEQEGQPCTALADVLPSVDVIVHTLSREQIGGVLKDLEQCLRLGAQSAFLLTARTAQSLARLEEAMASDYAVTIEALPDPDVITVTSIYTIGMPASQERVVEFLEAQRGEGTASG